MEHALGPEHLLLRFRSYGEYPTEEQACWRIVAWFEVGFCPQRVAALLAIDPHADGPFGREAVQKLAGIMPPIDASGRTWRKMASIDFALIAKSTPGET